MKYISFKILALFILLPPIMYLGTVNLLETYLANRYAREVKNVYLSDITDILNGLIPLKDGINEAIENYLQKNMFVRVGGQLAISVTTRQGNIIYPATYQEDKGFNARAVDPARLAEDNFKVLNQGLEVRVDTKIKPYSLLAVSIFLFYILAFLSGLYTYYRRATRRVRHEYRQKIDELNRLHKLEREREQQIRSLAEKRKSLLSDYRRLKETLEKEKHLAEKTEDELFDEIETLEKRLNQNLSLQQLQHREIEELSKKIQKLEKSRGNRERASDRLEKRFRILYKNIDITVRALEGISDLPEEMALKAEEVIHQLNANPDLVPVKRKVFSKKGKTTAFEVAFSYNGRLYFNKSKQNRIEILTVGTKNTQSRDLAYINNLH